MQNQSKGTISKPSQKFRGNTFPEKNRQGENGSGKTRSDGGQAAGLRLHILAKEIRTLRVFETMFITDDKDLSRDLFKMVDTEEKQLQAIEDLFLILKAQPRYKNLKEPFWKVDDDPIQVLCWILKKLGPLAKGNSWTTDTYSQGGKTRFRFIVYKYFHGQKVTNEDQFIPLDFLPLLKKRDQPLHNAIIELVALISKVNKVPLWDEDGDFSEQLKKLRSRRISGNGLLDEQIMSYKKGTAANYLKLIRQRQKVANIESVNTQVLYETFNSQRKRDIRWWIMKGIKLVKDGGNILDNSFIPNYNTGTPTTPFRQFKFVWSLHKNDFIKCRAFDKLSRDSKHGCYMPVMFTVTKPGQLVKQPDYNWYPEGLYDFMKEGMTIFTQRYRQYFYRDQFSQQKPPTQSLINVLDLHEIQTGFIPDERQFH